MTETAPELALAGMARRKFGNWDGGRICATPVKKATRTVAKPIPSYQVYKGTAFALVGQAVDFILSNINLRVGTRA